MIGRLFTCVETEISVLFSAYFFGFIFDSAHLRASICTLDKMFEWPEKAWITHDSGVAQLLSDPFLRAYQDDPRFIAFAQKVGVMPKAGTKP